jgi:predicted dehydrogenase
MLSNKQAGLHAGILGLGSIGTRHLVNLIGLGVGRFTVFDPQITRVPDAAQNADVGMVCSLDALLGKNPDFLVIANPSDMHAASALQGAKVGCDLFIEKPLSTSLGLLAELENLISEKGNISMVAANMRFHPGPATVKRLLDAGKIGKPIWARLHFGSRLPKWRPQSDYMRSYSASTSHGGAILDCIHEIDLAAWIFGVGDFVSATHLPASAIGLHCDGLAEIITKHRDGMMVTTHLNFIQQNYQRQIEVIGSEATLRWNIHNPEVEILKPSTNSLFFVDPEPIIHKYVQPDDLNQMYIEEMSHFIQCILTRTATCNPVSFAIKTTALAIQARDERRSLNSTNKSL